MRVNARQRSGSTLLQGEASEMRDSEINHLIKQQQVIMAHSVQSKSVGVAYLLLIFLGGIGAHRFYIGRPGSAILFYWVGWLSLGIVPLIAGIIDLITLHEIVRDYNIRTLEALKKQHGAIDEGQNNDLDRQEKVPHLNGKRKGY